MSGFHEETQMQERPQGHVEYLPDQKPESNDSPSVDATNRYNLPPFITKFFHPEISAQGNPYLVPNSTVLKAAIAEAPALLAKARSEARLHIDADKLEEIERVAEEQAKVFNAVCSLAGDGREWVARKRLIWPLTDEIGYHLFKAYTEGENLADLAAGLVMNDANISSFEDARASEAYQKKEFWFNVALSELAQVDTFVQAMEETEYALDPIVRRGASAEGMRLSRQHLSGKPDAPITNDGDTDVRAQMKAQLMASA